MYWRNYENNIFDNTVKLQSSCRWEEAFLENLVLLSVQTGFFLIFNLFRLSICWQIAYIGIYFWRPISSLSVIYGNIQVGHACFPIMPLWWSFRRSFPYRLAGLCIFYQSVVINSVHVFVSVFPSIPNPVWRGWFVKFSCQLFLIIA